MCIARHLIHSNPDDIYLLKYFILPQIGPQGLAITVAY